MHKSTKTPVLAALLASLLFGCRIVQLGIITVAAAVGLAEIPLSAPIKAHSIISIKGNAMPPDGDDGVVKYTSAHIEGVESELIVRSGHSCQSKPKTIEEVRRILLVHLKESKRDRP